MPERLASRSAGAAGRTRPPLPSQVSRAGHRRAPTSPSRALIAQPTSSLSAAKLPRSMYRRSWPAMDMCSTLPSRTSLKNLAAWGSSSIPTEKVTARPVTDPWTASSTVSSTQTRAPAVVPGDLASRSSRGPTDVGAEGPPVSRLAGDKKAMNMVLPPLGATATNPMRSPLPKWENTRQAMGTSLIWKA